MMKSFQMSNYNHKSVFDDDCLSETISPTQPWTSPSLCHTYPFPVCHQAAARLSGWLWMATAALSLTPSRHTIENKRHSTSVFPERWKVPLSWRPMLHCISLILVGLCAHLKTNPMASEIGWPLSTTTATRNSQTAKNIESPQRSAEGNESS